MITSKYVRSFAKYNQWQNANMIKAVDRLTTEQQMKNAGAFFGSIQGTLSHLLWGDSIWLDRLTNTLYQGSPINESGSVWVDWEQYKVARQAMDQRFLLWSESVTDA